MARKLGDKTRGFTLIEVLVVICLVTVVLLPIITVMSLNHRQMAQNEKTLKAKHLAQSVLEEIKALPWYEFKISYLDNQSYLQSTEPLQFGSLYQDHKYLEEQDSNPADDFIYRVRVWPSDNGLLCTVQVTVYYQEAGKDKWLSIYTEKLRR